MPANNFVLRKIDTGQISSSDSSDNLEKSSSPQHRSNSGKRISVVLTGDAEQLLDDLAHIQGISKSEALRKAIATESYFLEERRKGAKVFVRGKDNSLMEVVFR